MMLDFSSKLLERNFDSPVRSSTWRAPSNIALVKYWGKRPGQIPENVSVSFSLGQCVGETSIELSKDLDSPGVEVFVKGERRPSFDQKIKQFLERLGLSAQLQKSLRLSVKTSNSFPHSAGIASSASGFAALALCLYEVAYERSDFGELDLQSISSLARIGSGSACRSLWGGFSLWGAGKGLSLGSQQFAVAVKEIHQEFSEIRDTVCIVSAREKRVSSSAGHALMERNPFAQTKYEVSNQRAKQLLESLATGDWNGFIKITESEALDLHAFLMMGGADCILLAPESLMLIDKITQLREREKLRLCFTIDAGPNIHLLYHPDHAQRVRTFLEEEITPLMDSDFYWIDDKVGSGPQIVSG